MNKMHALVKQMQSAVNQQANKAMPTAYDTSAVVRRIEGNTAWVHFDGGVDETPVELTIAASVGDTVQVRVSGGSAWIQGNKTAPPTDDKIAKEANRQAVKARKAASEAYDMAVKALENVGGNSDQYFWHTETGIDTGSHITQIPKEQFLANPSAGGGNTLIRSNGVAMRNGLTELAKFMASGIQIGEDGAARTIIDQDELAMYTAADTPAVYINNAGNYSTAWYFIYEVTLAAGASFAQDLEKQSDGSYDTSSPIQVITDDEDVAEFTWGTGSSVQGTGTYSIAYNGSTTAPRITWTNTSGSSQTILCYAIYRVEAPAPFVSIGLRDWPNPGYDGSPGPLSFTVGQWTVADGARAAAFGQLSQANGPDSFTTGANNEVDGFASAAHGIGLRVPVAGQTVVGTYNAPDPGWSGGDDPGEYGWYAFMVGIGDDDNWRATGFGVTWSGEAYAELVYDPDSEISDEYGYYGGFSDEGIMTMTTRNKWHTILGESLES